MLRAALLLLIGLLATPAWAQPPLRWGGDAEGGAPFVEADPNDPARMMGFDVEIAELVARALGREPRFVQIAYSSLDQSARRGDFDIGLSGIEDTPGRRASLAASVPYYEFREVLTVRAADAARYPSLASLRGRPVGTLGGTIAYDLLLEAERDHGITAVSYDDDVHPYTDLALGRLDAVLLDHVLAERAMRRTDGLVDAGRSRWRRATTSSSRVRNRPRCATAVDEVLRGAMRDGSLERIFRKWKVWNDDQPRCSRGCSRRGRGPSTTAAATTGGASATAWTAARICRRCSGQRC